jgi:hypothetical protein
MVNLFDPNCVIQFSRPFRPWDWCSGNSERMRKWEYRRIRLGRLQRVKGYKRFRRAVVAHYASQCALTDILTGGSTFEQDKLLHEAAQDRLNKRLMGD